MDGQNSWVIRVHGLGKAYKIGSQARYKSLREIMSSSLARPFSWMKRGATAKSGQANGGRIPQVWALRDASLEVAVGDVLGIVGRNGAGKSTLLKILSRITEPTEGYAMIRGRVGALLEVGTGFHPELTGRENIFLNGTILGMRRAEVGRKLDEIVAFAGVEKFIDTPVKHFSSGMYTRLAFAVAAHLESEILLVDEVLAVGDAEFQKKCLGKMGEVARGGRTVIFVSHNLTAVTSLCTRAILLDEGRIVDDGLPSAVVGHYLESVTALEGEKHWPNPSTAPGNDRVRLSAVRVVSDGIPSANVDIDQEATVQVDFWTLTPDTERLCVNIYLLDAQGRTVLSTANTTAANLRPETWFGRYHVPGLYRATCTIPANFLNDNTYYVSVFLVSLGPLTVEVRAPEVIGFTVFDTGEMREAGAGSVWDGMVRIRLPWEVVRLAPVPDAQAVGSNEGIGFNRFNGG